MPGHQRAGDPVIAQSSAQAFDWRGAGDQLMDVTWKILHQANLPNIQKGMHYSANEIFSRDRIRGGLSRIV